MDDQNPNQSVHTKRYQLAPLYCRPWTLNGFSARLMESHYEINYGGAVRRLNAITHELASPERAKTADETHRLKRDEFAARNSALLHELYFASLGGDGRAVPETVNAAIKRDFGSFDRWRYEFIALANALATGTGWVILTYIPRESRLVNHAALDDGQCIAGGIPILALDMFEHAYHIDFGANAAAYVATFMRNIDWNVVQRRYVSAAKVEPPPQLEQAQFADLPSVSVEEVQAMIDAGDEVQIIDTRPRHYASKSNDIMKAAVWRDPERVDDWIGSLSKDRPVVTFCVYGFHVGCETAAALREAGFEASYMTGGHTAWKAIKGDLKLLSGADFDDTPAAEEQQP